MPSVQVILTPQQDEAVSIYKVQHKLVSKAAAINAIIDEFIAQRS